MEKLWSNEKGADNRPHSKSSSPGKFFQEARAARKAGIVISEFTFPPGEGELFITWNYLDDFSGSGAVNQFEQGDEESEILVALDWPSAVSPTGSRPGDEVANQYLTSHECSIRQPLEDFLFHIHSVKGSAPASCTVPSPSQPLIVQNALVLLPLFATRSFGGAGKAGTLAKCSLARLARKKLGLYGKTFFNKWENVQCNRNYI